MKSLCILSTISLCNGYEILKTCPFMRYFTQGLEVLPDNKSMILSSGRYDESKLAIVNFDMDTCELSQKSSIEMDKDVFAEGVTFVGGPEEQDGLLER